MGDIFLMQIYFSSTMYLLVLQKNVVAYLQYSS